MNEFEKRKQEIEIYIRFLNSTVENPKIIETAIGKDSEKTLLRKVLFANTYLLLYNLVESSIRNSIQDIYDHFEQEGVAFDDLKDNLKKLILTNMKAHNPTKFLERINLLTTDIVYESFDQEKIASGNLDAQKIREIASNYGFSSETEYSICKNGSKLLEIKNKRNDLAHGIISFSECGKDSSLSDVNNAFTEVSAYIENITNNIQLYIAEKTYLILDATGT